MSQINLNKDNYKFLESDNLNIDTPKFSLKGYKTYGKCVKVYDGDTIHVIFKMPYSDDCYKWIIRLNGIDTPEIKPRKDKPNRESEIVWAKKARAELLRLITQDTTSYFDNLDLKKDEIIQKLQENKNLVTVKCQEFDKY